MMSNATDELAANDWRVKNCHQTNNADNLIKYLPLLETFGLHMCEAYPELNLHMEPQLVLQSLKALSLELKGCCG